MIVAALLALLTAEAPSHSQGIDPKMGCRGNPAVVGQCFAVHGRIFFSNGTPSMRIWRVGTTRVLGVLPSEAEIAPAVVRKYVRSGTNLYGDFEVCPFEKETPGWMRAVCVESATNLVVERHIDGREAPEVFRIRR
jgi:hypothetical protein